LKQFNHESSDVFIILLSLDLDWIWHSSFYRYRAAGTRMISLSV